MRVCVQRFAVTESAEVTAYAAALRAELGWLVEQGLITANKTQFLTPEGPKQFSKPSIYEVSALSHTSP